MQKRILLVILALCFAGSLHAQSRPVVFFTDLTSGPNNGGENGNGTILTIYGKNFGAAQGASNVTVGGGAVAAYNHWGGVSKSPKNPLETISVAIGSAARTGTVVVNTSAGASVCEEDNAQNCQFTVRSGNIRCVSTTGSDSSAGNFPSSCWKTIKQAAHTLASGDIAYIENGVHDTGDDSFHSNVLVQNSCTSAAPCALVAYPQATVTIGATPNGDDNQGLRFDFNSNWVAAGITIRAQQESTQMNGATNIRMVNNDTSCPTGNGQDACNHSENGSSTLAYYGNYIHDTGTGCTDDCKEYHAFYMSTQTDHVWFGWNEVAPNPASSSRAGCRAIQFFSTPESPLPGNPQFDLHVHDSWVHDAICDGINFATVNASNGTVEAYNNVVYRVGTGPDPTQGGSPTGSNYACINVGNSGAAAVLLYNNTFFDCGGRGFSEGDAGAFGLDGPTKIKNNIVQLVSGEGYFSRTTVNAGACSGSSGSTNNIFTGVGANTYCASTYANTINSNPLFVSTATPNFHVQTGSPAITAGSLVAPLPTWDFDGGVRGTPPYEGAYDAVGVAPPPPPPPSLSSPIIITNTLPPGTSGQMYSASLQASSGTPPYSWSMVPLIPGLSITAATGLLSGTPTQFGTYEPSFTVTDAAAQTGSSALEMIIDPAVAPPPPVSGGAMSLLASTAPANKAGNDSNSVELGMRFSSSVAGNITAIKFYKATNSTGTHTGHVWGPTGAMLFTGTFSGETASGWQTLTLANPVAISANTTYTASYHTSQYVWSEPFAWPMTNAPLATPANAGVYQYGSGSSFPSFTFNSSNYFVDVVFVPTGTPPPPPPPPPPSPAISMNCAGLVCTISPANMPTGTPFVATVQADGVTATATGKTP